MGYHKKPIPKGEYGDISKVKEEVEEYIDATEQGVIIMQLTELADIYGALEAVARNHNLLMEDLRRMNELTKEAFEEGRR